MFTFRLEIYIGQLLISGNYEMLVYRRLSDALNSDLQRYISLKSAIVAPVDRPQKAERLKELLIDRHQIILVAPLKEPEPPPDFIPPPNIVRDQQQVMFFSAGFAVRGNFFTRPNLTLVETLNQTTDSFIPLNHVRVAPLDGRQPFSRDFVCLGRNHIQASYLISEFESI